MGQRRWLMLGAVALVILLLFSVGSAVRQSGWNEGYMIGRLSAAGQDGGAALLLPYAYGYAPRGVGGPFLGGLGILLPLGLFLFLFVGFGRFMRFRAWQGGGAPWQRPEGAAGEGGPWAWHGRHGRRPWCGEQSEPADTQSAPKPPVEATDDSAR